jgi:hypothetical protein
VYVCTAKEANRLLAEMEREELTEEEVLVCDCLSLVLMIGL